MAEMTVWWDRADDCGRLLCPLLVDEVLAVAHLGPKMVHNPVCRTMKSLNDPGQVATLTGAVMRLLAPTDRPRQEGIWWRTYGPLIENAPRCSGADPRPDCRRGDPCPLDVAHEYAAASLMYDDKGKPRIDHIIKPEGLLADWSLNLPRIAGHVAWLTYRQLLAARQPQRAATALAYAEALGLHRMDPNLAVAASHQLLGRGKADEATELLTSVLRTGSTNPADQAVHQALARTRAAARPAAPALASPDPVHSRPVTRVRPNPYRVGP
jgi:hypothetical protein